jgi:hypothetical protein
MTEETFDQQVQRKPRKGKIALTVGLILLVGGIAAAAVGGWNIYDTITSQFDLQRVLIPGQEEIRLAQTGDYDVFLETRSRVDGKVYQMADENISGLEATLTWAETGEKIPLKSPSGDFTYSIGAYEGRALFQFHADKTGQAILQAQYADGQGPQAVLAVGQVSMGELIGTILLLVLGVLAAFVGLITTIVGLIRFATSG